jgi:hypothetical protein
MWKAQLGRQAAARKSLPGIPARDLTRLGRFRELVRVVLRSFRADLEPTIFALLTGTAVCPTLAFWWIVVVLE